MSRIKQGYHIGPGGEVCFDRVDVMGLRECHDPFPMLGLPAPLEVGDEIHVNTDDESSAQ